MDVHSHWGGLALLLIVFGAIFQRVGYAERTRLLLAWMLVAGASIFPLGVLAEIWDRGMLPKAIAVLGSALVTIALAAVAVGFARAEKVNQL